MITLFWPDRLWTNGGIIARDADGKPANWRTKPEGTWLDGEDFEGLARWLANATPANDKEQHGGFTLAKINGGRCIANVEQVTALGLDGDDSGKSTREVHDLLSGYRHVVYSTFSSKPEAPRWRAIVALSRPATGSEHARYVKLAHANMRAAGVNLDASAVDPCRLWYVPAYRMREHFECYSADGAPFPVESALANAVEFEAEEIAERKRAYRERSQGRGGDRVERARRYIAKMPAAHSGAGGHAATFAVARKIVQDFELGDTDAAALLAEYNQRCDPPWSDRDLAHKLAQAKRARVSNPVADRVRL